MKMRKPLLALFVIVFLLTGCQFLFPSATITGRVLRDHASSPALISTSRMSMLEDPRDRQLPSSPGRLIVGLKPSGGDVTSKAEPATRSLALELMAERSNGLSLLGAIEGARVAVFETENMQRTAEELREDPNVRFVEQDLPFFPLSHSPPNDPRYPDQWPLAKVNAEDAWHDATGSGVKIAIIDSGYEPGHEDLANEDFTWNFRYETSSVHAVPECASHGQHVAGIVSATQDNNIGVTGLAPMSIFQFLDVSPQGGDAEPDCPLLLSSIVSALDWVTGTSAGGARADIVNMSLGGSTYSTALWEATFRAYKAGVTLVAAAGNVAGGEVVYPAAFPEVLAVSATGPTDVLASYSTTGPEVFLSAPGGDSFSNPLDGDAVLSTLYDGTPTYGYMQGTSMASPVVSGIAALVQEVNPSLSPLEIADVLADSSVDLGASGWDPEYGYGRVDAMAAVSLARTRVHTDASYRIRTDFGHDLRVPFHGEFTLVNVPLNALVQVESDDDGDGVFGEPGEYGGLFRLGSDSPDSYNFFYVSPIG